MCTIKKFTGNSCFYLQEEAGALYKILKKSVADLMFVLKSVELIKMRVINRFDPQKRLFCSSSGQKAFRLFGRRNFFSFQ